MLDIQQSPGSIKMICQAIRPLFPQCIFGHCQDGSGVDFAGIVGPHW